MLGESRLVFNEHPTSDFVSDFAFKWDSASQRKPRVDAIACRIRLDRLLYMERFVRFAEDGWPHTALNVIMAATNSTDLDLR